MAAFDEPFVFSNAPDWLIEAQQRNPQMPPKVTSPLHEEPVYTEQIERQGPGLDWPPGIAGALAREIFNHSIRPVQEISIATALAILAGVCGRGWNTHTGTGLNLYIAFVARSAIGKEAIADAVQVLVQAAVEKGAICAPDYFTFNSMASGQGLIRFMSENPCLLHVSGEFGHDIVFMATEKTGPHATLRQNMTKLYHKSGAASIAGGINYSKTETNINISGAASYSIIGETTPGRFYEALNGKMMSDGFMSRFIVIDYSGPRPPENENRAPFADGAVTWFMELVLQAAQKAHLPPNQVTPDPDASTLLKAFNRECDDHINGTDDESRRQMWNRAQLNSLKVAGLLAVADNYLVPIITPAQADWSIKLIKRNIAAMTKRLDGGDVGDGDDARERKLAYILKQYLLNTVPASYKVPDTMRQNSIAPKNYLHIRTKQVAAFYDHKLGHNRALDDTIASMIASGYLMEVQKDRVVDAYNYHGKAYRIIRLPL